MPTPAKHSPADADELRRLQRMLTPATAGAFDLEFRHRPEFGMYVIDMYSPMGETVINEFNFKSEAAVQEAVDDIKKLLPPDGL
jgi:hypothetical protein